ncbi:MAG: IS1380 family transposase [Candidatus Saccharicenans sp.]|nr:IS1380 family transposase [Candidatus Saccharicenans sp.]
MIRQEVKNFKLGSLHGTKVTASSGLALLMTFAKDIGLGKQLDQCFSHLKRRQRGYSVSAKIVSFLEMIIKGGDRLSDIDILRSDPGLMSLLRLEGVPRPNTLSDLARRFKLRDIHRLAEYTMRLVVRAFKAKKVRRVILDIDSTLGESEAQIAERTYEGFRGFNPLLGMVRAGGMKLASFSLFRPGNASPQSNNLSLVRKIDSYLDKHLPSVQVLLRSDSAGYSYRLMGYCDQRGIGFVIGGRWSEATFQIIKGIEHWERLRGSQENEEVGESLHFVGPEKQGAVYRLIVVRKRTEQPALFPEFACTYRLYVTNTDWSAHKVVRFYRQRGQAENLIRELKQGYGLNHILSEDFLANAVFFQLQLLAYNLVELFKYTYLSPPWWPLQIKQLRFRLLNIAGLVVHHAHQTVLRLSVHYRYINTFRQVFQKLRILPSELRL